MSRDSGSSIEVHKDMCHVCKQVAARYRCPQCALRSCSVACVKLHKVQLACSGVRDKTVFVSLKEFDNITLLSDYRLLEEVGRKRDCLKRHRSEVHNGVSRRAKHLQNVARRNGTKLRLLPSSFTRRRTNSSIYNFRDNEIRWRVDWLFPYANTSYTSRQSPESLTLCECMELMLEACSPLHRHSLESFISEGLHNWKFLLKPSSANQRYTQFHGDKSLKENLSGQILVEYPVIEVVLQCHLPDYNLDIGGNEMKSVSQDGIDEQPSRVQDVVTVKEIHSDLQDQAGAPNTTVLPPVS